MYVSWRHTERFRQFSLVHSDPESLRSNELTERRKVASESARLN
jgi:hypothetical protein